ncbi:ATP-grasp domain-containing protein [Streptomyces sp. MZ04]|uniref:ATP-grasp domain-containing protein n=1 Tax=Streptomyces sp. MZ04 TaxID=2559236 RepID=UPI00107EC7F6|nr:ATP-grasp domain-containing protein [Streptomyces sp. MZ04]TGB14626.1 ATP-grasp domain-containing protein [Streptomyces sp. MZ04]
MAEHVLVFGVGYDIPERMRAFGEESGDEVVTSVMCQPEQLDKIEDTEKHARIIVLRPDAPDSEWLTLARALHAAHPVTRIGSFYDDCRPQAALVARDLGLTAHSPEIVELIQNKHAMRRRLAETGVEETASAIVHSVEALKEFAAEHGYPCVVKPVDGAASKGVSVLEAPDGAESAFQRANGIGTGSQVAVEEFLTGNQYSVEGISEKGEHVIIAITRKYSDPGSLVELGHVLPAPLNPAQQSAIERHVVATLNALEVEFGPTHTEIILTPSGPRVIETHLRTGGDELWNLVTDATGVDMIECQLRQILGETVLPGVHATLSDTDRVTRCEAIWFAGAPSSGTLIEVTGADAERPQGVTLEVLGKPGTQLSGLQNSFSRLARARAHAATAEEALDLARQAIAGLELITRQSADQTELL